MSDLLGKLILVQRLRAERRAQNRMFYLIVVMAFMWIAFLARLGYLLAMGRI